jgi:hypothetical protein
MRVADRRECEAYGFAPKAALRRSMAASSWCLTALVDGHPEAMFGLVVRSAIEGLGEPWMLATNKAYQHGRDMIRVGPTVLATMADSTPTLRNLCRADNHPALRMLARWGFEIEDGSVMISGAPFRRFELRR